MPHMYLKLYVETDAPSVSTLENAIKLAAGALRLSAVIIEQAATDGVMRPIGDANGTKVGTLKFYWQDKNDAEADSH